MEGTEKTIMCVGLCCDDLVNICDHYPEEDSDIRAVDQYRCRGGNAANSCTVLSVLGAPCEYLGTLAENHQLGFLKDDFNKCGILINHCVYYKDSVSPTSICIINIQNGSRTVLHFNNTLPEITYENFKRVDLKTGHYKWIHFEGRPNVDELQKMLKHVDDYNSELTDPSGRITTSVELEKPRKNLVSLVDKADYVFVGKDHAAVHNLQSMEQTAEFFCRKCREGAVVICPWGSAGACAKTWDGKSHSVPAVPPPKLVDTLGAGDTFVAATVLSLSRGLALKESVEYGCKVAGAKCGMRGFQDLKTLQL